MKKTIGAFLCIAMALAFSLPSQAQVTLTNNVDSLIQSTTVYSTSSKQYTPFDLVSLQVVLTKSSGTPTGYVIPQASIDGVNYANISTDTLSLANVSVNTKVWSFNKTQYSYYRLACTATSTTQKSTLKSYMLVRAYPR